MWNFNYLDLHWFDEHYKRTTYKEINILQKCIVLWKNLYWRSQRIFGTPSIDGNAYLSTLYSYCYRKGDLHPGFWIIACVIKGPELLLIIAPFNGKLANYVLLQQTFARPNSIRDTMDTFVFGNKRFYNRHLFIKSRSGMKYVRIRHVECMTLLTSLEHFLHFASHSLKLRTVPSLSTHRTSWLSL